MKTIFSIEISGLPPTINHYYRRGYHSVYKTAEAREWQEEIVSLMREQRSGQNSYTGAVELEIIYQVQSRRKWDIDNRVKALQDCLELAGIIKNDNQIEILKVRREYRSGKDRTLLTVRSI